MNFTKEIQDALEKVTTEKLPEFIEKNAEKMVSDIVESIFRYGNVKDSIKKKIEESINVNLERFDTIDYSILIGKVINESLLEQVNLQPIIEMTRDIVGFVNMKEIKLQGIADIFKEASMEENDSDHDGGITFIVKENEEYKWIEIFADIEPDKEESRCSFKFIFSTKEDRGQIFSMSTSEKYYDTDRKNITPFRLAHNRGIEAKIFRLYSAQVKITDFYEDIYTDWSRY